MLDRRLKTRARTFLTVLAFGAIASFSGAIAISLPTTFVAQDAADRDRFGTAVDVSGTTIAVGAPGTDVERDDAGAVHLYQAATDADAQSSDDAAVSDVAEVATLVASDGELADAFGASVAISGDVVLVGAPGVILSELNEGAAYLFVRDGDTWTEAGRLRLETVAKNDMFGSAVGLDGGVAVVGAPGANVAGEDSGTAVVHERRAGAWQATATLEPDDAAAGQRFGSAVAVDGARILIGASGDVIAGEDPGAAYLFERTADGWTQVATLTPSSAGGGSAFGDAVALDGDLALVGARFADLGGSDRGAAYLFARTGAGWAEVAELTAPEPSDRDAYGQAVALAGEVALVGAPRVDDPQRDAGAVWAYAADGGAWSMAERLSPAEAENYDEFGSALAADASVAVVGTPSDIPAGSPDDAMTGSGTLFRGVR